ncbi:cytochrome b [Xylophilus rhododendri]|uniref:Cytochrome b n=1 Tax=Xylophilus rhododendri TaxID=2697032 RepID=A0A857J917_9BURK|nr:cytochrome b [Xylophilus rhododendri]QHJ00367.1 cytochrome b [Xylophilus rhododendri]
MTTSPTRPVRYSAVAIALHWILAAAITGIFLVGLYMTSLSFSPLRLKLYNWHKWAGVAILTLSVLRLLWRLARRPPELPEAVSAAMPRWQHVAHHGTHHLMYALFFIVPLVGWAYSSAAGFPIVLFGVLPLPGLAPDPELAALIKPWHQISAYALAGLVVLHVAAVVKHQLIDRDGLLWRMLPGRG